MIFSKSTPDIKLDWFGWFGLLPVGMGMTPHPMTCNHGGGFTSRNAGPHLPPRCSRAASDYTDRWRQLGLILERTLSEITSAPSSSPSVTCVFSTRDRSLLSGMCRSSFFWVFRPPWLGLQGSRVPQPSRVYLSPSFIPMQDKVSGGTGNRAWICLEKHFSTDEFPC